jgi:hypothetical protein
VNDNTSIVLSGAGRKPKGKKLNFIQNEKIKTGYMGVNDFVKREREMNKKLKSKRKKELKELFGAGMDSDDEDMDGAGFFDEVKKGYNKTKSAVKSKTGQKIVGALKDDKAVMKEFNKAKKQLMDYQNGVRKTKPGKAAMAILEKSGVISKIEDEFKGGVNRLKKAKRWRDFSEETAYKGIDLGAYGYRKAKDAVNPIGKTVRGWFGGAQGGAKRGPSMWIAHVKKFSEANNIPYKEALKAAGPSYQKLKAQM